MLDDMWWSRDRKYSDKRYWGSYIICRLSWGESQLKNYSRETMLIHGSVKESEGAMNQKQQGHRKDKELIYPPPRHFWRWHSFSPGGICWEGNLFFFWLILTKHMFGSKNWGWESPEILKSDDSVEKVFGLKKHTKPSTKTIATKKSSKTSRKTRLRNLSFFETNLWTIFNIQELINFVVAPPPPACLVQG